MKGAKMIFVAQEITTESWLRKDPRFAWFVKGYEYAATQTRAIPALASIEPELLYFAVDAIMRANKEEEPPHAE